MYSSRSKVSLQPSTDLHISLHHNNLQHSKCVEGLLIIDFPPSPKFQYTEEAGDERSSKSTNIESQPNTFTIPKSAQHH